MVQGPARTRTPPPHAPCPAGRMASLKLLKCRSIKCEDPSSPTPEHAPYEVTKEHSNGTSPSSTDEQVPVEQLDSSTLEDDVSSICFGESVTAVEGEQAQRFELAKKLLKRHSSVSPSSIPGVRFVRSDSLAPSRAMSPDCLSAESPATALRDNTTKTTPVISSLVYLSLVTKKKNDRTGKHVVRESLYRHICQSLSSREIQGHQKASLPVDVDNGSFVDNDNVSVINTVAQQHLRKRKIHAAIEVYEGWMEQSSSSYEGVHSQLAVLHVLGGNRTIALRHAQSSLSFWQEEAPLSQNVVTASMQVALVQVFCEKLSPALDKMRQALHLELQLVGYHHAVIPLLLNNLACIHALEKHYDDAVECLKESLYIQRRHEKSRDLSNLNHMATTLCNLGVVSALLENYQDASEYLEEGLMVFQSLLAPDDSFVKLCKEELSSLSGMHDNKIVSNKPNFVFGNVDGIPMRHSPLNVDTLWMGSLVQEYNLENRIRDCISACFDNVAYNSSETASLPVDVDGDLVVNAELHLSTIYALVVKYLEEKEYDEAVDVLRSCVKSIKETRGEFHPLAGTAMHNIGMVQLLAGHCKDAMWHFSEAVNLRMDALGTEHPLVAESIMKVGLIQIADGDFDTAYVTFTQVLHTRRKTVGCNQPEIAKILNILGYIQFEFGSLLAALKSLEEAVAIQRSVSCEQHVAETLASMGFLYAKGQDWKEATTVLQEAFLIQKRVLGEHHSHTIVTKENLSYCRTKSRGVAFEKMDMYLPNTWNCSSFGSLGSSD